MKTVAVVCACCCLAMLSVSLVHGTSVTVSRNITVKPTPEPLLDPRNKVNITLECTGSQSDLSYYNNNYTVNWDFKDSSGTLHPITNSFYRATGSPIDKYAESNFKTGRFEFIYRAQKDTGLIQFILHINGVKFSDDGEYTCSLLNIKTKAVADTKTVKVTVVPQSVRLVNGFRPSQGRLEVFHDNRWGTVCDDKFNSSAATVVCRMLGFTGNLFAPTALGMATYGQGTGPIWLDGVECNGIESSLSNCLKNDWGQSNCNHTEDVGVDCYFQTPDIRLVNGSRSSLGRLEVFYNNTWGTVCSDSFNRVAATVVCRMLGFTGNQFRVAVLDQASFGQGTGPIWLYKMECYGNESSLFNCRVNHKGHHNCGNNKDVGVDCDYIPARDLTVPAGDTLLWIKVTVPVVAAINIVSVVLVVVFLRRKRRQSLSAKSFSNQTSTQGLSQAVVPLEATAEYEIVLDEMGHNYTQPQRDGSAPSEHPYAALSRR